MTFEPQQLGLVHLVRPPLADSNGKAPPLLLLLHGVGSNEQDLFSLAPALDPAFLVLSLRAPFEQRPGRYAWFSTEFRPDGIKIDPAMAEASRLQLLDFINEATAAYGTDPGQVFMAGFSQGAIMSASVRLTVPGLVAGTVMMSGRILPEIAPIIAPREQLAGQPFLVIHGLNDRVLPVTHGRASRDLLTSLGVDLTYQEYEMGHEISRDSLGEVTSWLTRHLNNSLK